VLRRKFRNWKFPFNDENIDRILKKYRLSSSVDLYGMIYREELDLLEIKKLLSVEPEKTVLKKSPAIRDEDRRSTAAADGEVGADVLELDRNLDKINYKLARCCNPIPGDPVFGFITISRGITIHRRNCPNARQLLTRFGYRKIDIRWKEKTESSGFEASIRVTGIDRMGILNDLSQVISNDIKANMLSLKVDAKGGVFTALVRLIVRNARHLDELLNRLLKVPGVTKAIRLD
jgi:GTP pyrophosphokinase